MPFNPDYTPYEDKLRSKRLRERLRSMPKARQLTTGIAEIQRVWTPCYQLATGNHVKIALKIQTAGVKLFGIFHYVISPTDKYIPKYLYCDPLQSMHTHY